MFGVKLENFDSAFNIKTIKEVRIFTYLGPKKAKEIMEKTLIILNHGITKESENEVIENIKDARVTIMEWTDEYSEKVKIFQLVAYDHSLS